jgi:hypothetical protein
MARPAREHCSVNFWNLSPRELVISTAGKRLTLAPGKRMALDLDRQFTWQVEGREAEVGTVAPDAPGLEIVIRN